jgi:hypothetical protein
MDHGMIAHLLHCCCVPCRQGHIEAATLSALLKQHTTADLSKKLQALIDYLMLPDPVTKYLPPRSKVPLMYVSVLDLHCQAAANYAVQTILSSTAFSAPSVSRDVTNHRAAFLYVSMVADDTCLVKVQVCVVRVARSGPLSSWKPSSKGPEQPELSSDTVVELLSERTRKSCLYKQISATPPISADHKQLVSMIKAGLQEGLAGCEVTVIDTEVASCQYFKEPAPLWVVSW